MNLPQNLFDGDVRVQAFLCQPNKEIIGEIMPYDFNATFKFNTYSEISFTIDKYYNDLFDGKTKVCPYYDWIESLRVIYLRGIGHFVIQDVDENEADTYTKSITCFSLEYSTGQKYLENFYVNTGEEGSIETMYHARQYGAEYTIDKYNTHRQVNVSSEDFDPYQRYYIKQYTGENDGSWNFVEEQVLNNDDYLKYNGSYNEITLWVKRYDNVRFYWPQKPELSLLHNVFDRIPEWKIGHVDKELCHQERTFSEDRTAVYDFLYNTAADTLNFVMVWDSINGVCNFYKTEEDGIITDTYIRTNTYNQGFVYYADTNGTVADPQPQNADDIINGEFYINVGQSVETQWDTDVYISRENLTSELDISYSTDDIKTKLKITGSDNLDVRDVNLGQNYILNLNYYNDPSWFGEDLYLKYNTYINKLADYTEQYKKLVSARSAAYNEYSDLMNYVPVEPRVMLVGDEFEKLYCVKNQYLPASTEFDEDTTYYIYKYDNLNEKYVYDIADPQPKTDQDLKNKQYHVKSPSTLDALVNDLKIKLHRYKVDLQDNGLPSTTAKTDDVLLTLEDNSANSATIRVRINQDELYKLATEFVNTDTYFSYDEKANRYTQVSMTKGTFVANKYYTYGDYLVYRTRTDAATGTSNTISFTLKEWVEGKIQANYNGMNLKGFKIKSIGTLGAYFCLVRDEVEKANLEDYGIRLLQEKQDTYTKIFITQTEGYMNKEGAQCIASDTEPTGTDYADGTKWLDTDGVRILDEDTDDERSVLPLYIWNNTKWEAYNPTSDDPDIENYARFDENYRKLGNVQAVLAEKQLKADYLLNGVAITDRRITKENINADNLLVAAQSVFPQQTLTLQEYNKEFGYITFNVAYIVSSGSYREGITYYSDEKGTIANPQPSVIQNEINAIAQEYNALVNGNVDYSKRPFISEETMKTYYPEFEGEVATTYSQGHTIGEGDNIYTIDITPILENGTILSQKELDNYTLNLLVNNGIDGVLASDKSKLIIHIQKGDYDKEYWDTLYEQLDEIKNKHWELVKSFREQVYYVAENYAVYVLNDTPYVSYAHSQGLCLAKMNMIKEEVDMSNPDNFTEQELVRLSPFIREDEFSDSNFLLTSYESEEEEMKVKQELLKAGEEELKKICQPKLSFNATMANILAIPEFAPIRNQFKLGNFVKVGIREGYVKRARLLEVNINFDDPSDFSVTFGDLISTRSEIDKHAELLQQAVTAGKSVAANQGSWQRAVDKSTELDRRINDGLRDAALSVGSAQGQSITWDSNGIWGRKLIDGTADQYEPEQFRLINNKLVFSSDGFKTSKAVFGKYTINGEERWGPLAEYVTAETIEGKFLKGGSIQIGNPDDENGSLFIVHEDGSVEIKSNGQDKYASVNAIESIKDAYQYHVELSYTGYTIFNTTGQKCTVTCKVKDENGDEVTLPDTTIFKWYLNGVLLQNKTTSTIEITSDDITGSAQLNCQVTFNK